MVVWVCTLAHLRVYMFADECMGGRMSAGLPLGMDMACRSKNLPVLVESLLLSFMFWRWCAGIHLLSWMYCILNGGVSVT